VRAWIKTNKFSWKLSWLSILEICILNLYTTMSAKEDFFFFFILVLEILFFVKINVDNTWCKIGTLSETVQEIYLSFQLFLLMFMICFIWFIFDQFSQFILFCFLSILTFLPEAKTTHPPNYYSWIVSLCKDLIQNENFNSEQTRVNHYDKDCHSISKQEIMKVKTTEEQQHQSLQHREYNHAKYKCVLPSFLSFVFFDPV